ncbi:hypothetical protein HMPREF1861_02328 [Corynebacterium kroppenstedtii]|nr:hypothetical protein HMPREF1861_02328 [Corynebacterium kroppenstedtii]
MRQKIDREKAAEKQKHLNQRVETELEISFSNSPRKRQRLRDGLLNSSLSRWKPLG